MGFNVGRGEEVVCPVGVVRSDFADVCICANCDTLLGRGDIDEPLAWPRHSIGTVSKLNPVEDGEVDLVSNRNNVVNLENSKSSLPNFIYKTKLNSMFKPLDYCIHYTHFSTATIHVHMLYACCEHMVGVYHLDHSQYIV